MSKRAIAVLGLLAAALVAYVLMFERTSITSKERSERAGRVLTSFVRDKVDRLVLQRKGKRVVLERKRADGELGGWQLREPTAAKADDDAVDQVLGELEWLSARRTLALGADDLKRFGLDAPRYRVSFAAGRETHTLVLGREDVHGEGVYVRVDDEPALYVVPKTVLEPLDHEPGHFRDKQLFSQLTVAWARRLELVQEGTTHVLVKEGDRWWLEAAPRGYADGKRVDELLHALSELRAGHHLEPSERAAAEAALAQPSARVEVTVVPEETREDKTPKRLSLELAGACGGHAGERYARATGGEHESRVGSGDKRAAAASDEALLVCVREEALKPLAIAPPELREARLFSGEPSAIERVKLERGADKLALARAGAEWKLNGATPADRDAVEAWLADLAAARATSFMPVEGFSERGSLTLERGEGKPERIAVGELGSDGEVLVKRGDEPLLARFPGSVFNRLLPTAKRFRSLEIWAAHQPSQVTAIEVRADARARTLRLEAGRWQASPSATALDSERVRELVRVLVDLRARAYVSDQARPGHGFSAAGSRVKLSLAQGGSLSLELGVSTERGAYARVDDAAVVEVGSDVPALLRELAGGPAAPTEQDAGALQRDALHELEEDEHEH